MELPNIIRLDHFLTQQQYAKAGNLSVNTTRNRIKSKLIACIEIDGQALIDIWQSPPAARYHKPHPSASVSLPDGIDINRLVYIPAYANRKKQSASKFYEAILSGKIFGLVLGDKVFCYKDELGQNKL